MKVLHVLDQSLPNISGYSLRSKYIMSSQKELGIDVMALTTPALDRPYDVENIDSISYYRSRVPKILNVTGLANISWVKPTGMMTGLIGRLFRLLSPPARVC